MVTQHPSSNPWDIDPKRWERCVQQSAATMIAAGWIPKARKFDEVRMRKARGLFRLG